VITAIAVAGLVVPLISLRLIARGFTIPSGATSMDNTVRPGDTILVVKGRDVRRGDVVVLSAPVGSPGPMPPGVSFVRRVIGLPGDHVACCTAGHITVNGKPLDENYLDPGDQPATSAFSVTLGPGQLWVLGDHRSVAIDSRMWGPVRAADVVGRVEMVVGGSTFLRTPQTFIATGLAPPDDRTPWAFWDFTVGIVALPLLVVMIVIGVIRTLIRRRRHRRSLRAAVPVPSL
jgi:signal peptidase I